jgi:hypothetical protein
MGGGASGVSAKGALDEAAGVAGAAGGGGGAGAVGSGWTDCGGGGAVGAEIAVRVWERRGTDLRPDAARVVARMELERRDLERVGQWRRRLRGRTHRRLPPALVGLVELGRRRRLRRLLRLPLRHHGLGRDLRLERRDRLVDLAIARERTVQLVLLDGLELVAAPEVDLGEGLGGDQVAGSAMGPS